MKRIVITGASRGIGKEIALGCLEQGYQVIGLSRSKNTFEKFPSFSVDVGNLTQVQSTIEHIEKNMGPIYGVINAAALYGDIGSILEANLEGWKHAIEVNLLGTTWVTHSCVKYMAKRKEGKIILFSGGGEGPMANFSAYVASKGAIWRLTETWAKELIHYNIYINAIAPGAVNTGLVEEVLKAGPEKVGEDFYKHSLIQKSQGGVPSSKAKDLCLYLLSDKASTLTGKILSAVWDPYLNFNDISKINASNIYTMRRVKDFSGNTQ